MNKLDLLLKPVLSILLGSITFLEVLDLSLRVTSGSAALVAAFWAVKSYRSKIRLENIQYEIERERLKKLRDEKS